MTEVGGGVGVGGSGEDAQAQAGVLRIFPPEEGATRIVLVRHGEAECNLNHIIGGPKGCTGLTALGRHQVAALADRLYESGELQAKLDEALGADREPGEKTTAVA